MGEERAPEVKLRVFAARLGARWGEGIGSQRILEKGFQKLF